MVTVLRSGGFRIVIYLDDHEPAHVHVIGAGEAKTALFGKDGEPALVWTHGFSAANLRKAMRIVGDAQAELIVKWKEIHG